MFKKILSGAIIGFINGFFGAFGGVVAVLSLKKAGEEQKKAHAMAVAIILPISVISAAYYYIRDFSDIPLTLKIIPFGIIGAFIGSFLLKHLSVLWIRGFFSVLMIYSAIVFILR